MEGSLLLPQSPKPQGVVDRGSPACYCILLVGASGEPKRPLARQDFLLWRPRVRHSGGNGAVRIQRGR
jgi:hypothetical protein